MYKICLLAGFLACVVAVPLPGEEIQITKLLANADTDGTYAYEVGQSDGTSISEQGQGGVAATGQYSYISPEGIPVQVSYVADENGFQPQSDWLPTPPPIPEAILRSIEYIQQHPTAEELLDREVRSRQI